MLRRLPAFLSLALLLAGCGGMDERQKQICTAALQTIVGADASVRSAESLPDAAHGVVLRFRIADAAVPVPIDPARAFAFLAQQLVNGVAIGALLGLVALGYALVYGVTGTIQFAYGELFMIGAYVMVIAIFALNALGGAIVLTLS